MAKKTIDTETTTIMEYGRLVDVSAKEASENKKRKGRWIACVVYPDNIYQMSALSYMVNLGLTMCYIQHEPETDEKKPHIHCLIYFDAPRSASGFCSSFGRCPCLKTPDGFEVIPPENVDIIRQSRPADIIEKPIFSHAEVVSIPSSYYLYMFHKDFKSVMAGKKPYDEKLMHYCGDGETLRKLKHTEFNNKGTLLLELQSYFDTFKTCRAVMAALLRDSRQDLIGYVEGHAYFIRSFMEQVDDDSSRSCDNETGIILPDSVKGIIRRGVK